MPPKHVPYDVPSTDPEQNAEKDKATEHLLHQTSNLISRNRVLVNRGLHLPVYPTYNAADPKQIPLLPRKHPNPSKLSFCINTEHWLFPRWKGMIDRCYRENSTGFAHYGMKQLDGGVWICRNWAGVNPPKLVAMNFIQYVISIEICGRQPTADHSMDRIRNNYGYSPQNCRWGSKLLQARNKGTPVFNVPRHLANKTCLAKMQRMQAAAQQRGSARFATAQRQRNGYIRTSKKGA